MFTRSLCLIPVALFSLVAACGGGSPSVDGLFDELAQTQCQKAFDCMSSYDDSMHNGETFADYVGNTTNVDDCTTMFENQQATGLAEIKASVDAGRIDYNSDDVGACLDAESAVTCDEFFGQNGATVPASVDDQCSMIFVGTVAEGGSCTIDGDCASADDGCDTGTHTCTALGS